MSLLETDNRSVENIGQSTRGGTLGTRPGGDRLYNEKRWALDPAEIRVGHSTQLILDIRSKTMNGYRMAELCDSSIGDVFTLLRDGGHSFRRDLWHSRSGGHSIRLRFATSYLQRILSVDSFSGT